MWVDCSNTKSMPVDTLRRFQEKFVQAFFDGLLERQQPINWQQHAALLQCSWSTRKPVAMGTNPDAQPRSFKTSEPAMRFDKNKGKCQSVMRYIRWTKVDTIKVRSSHSVIRSSRKHIRLGAQRVENRDVRSRNSTLGTSLVSISS